MDEPARVRRRRREAARRQPHPLFRGPVMPAPRFRGITRPGVDPFSASHKPPLPPAEYDRRAERGLLIERNCVIELRDGTEIFCDLYRPEGATRDLPILLAW